MSKETEIYGLSGIYLVITSFFPTKTSFRGPYILDQVKALSELTNFKIKVLRPKGLFSKLKDYEYEGITVHYFKSLHLPSNFFPFILNMISTYFLLRKLRKNKIEIQSIKVVHAHTTSLGMFAKYLKNRNNGLYTIVQHHGLDVLHLDLGFAGKLKYHRKILEDYYTKICNTIDLHIGVSNKTLESLKNYKGIKVNNSIVVYNGVDSNKFYPELNYRSSDLFTIGCIGNFNKTKDQITLLKALNQLIRDGIINVQVKFIGSGPELIPCKRYVNDNNLENWVIFLDEVHHDQLRPFFNSLNLFVLPSYYEAFGCVYLEAFACGVPFIGVKNQGITEIVDSKENEWFIEPKDYRTLSKLIKRSLLNDIKQEISISPEIKTCLEILVDKLNHSCASKEILNSGSNQSYRIISI